MSKSNSYTIKYLNANLKLFRSKTAHSPHGKIIIKGAKGNNLKNITAKIPLGLFITVTGVSGAGKSSLVVKTLYREIKRRLYGSSDNPLEFDKMSGLEKIRDIIKIDQAPIGRTPRSNPATYTKVFDIIRELYASTKEAKIRGYKKRRFSFNLRGGRCEKCKGLGFLDTKEENQLLTKIITTFIGKSGNAKKNKEKKVIVCDKCNGKKYNKKTLEILYHDKSIADVLDMSVSKALKFFEGKRSIIRYLKALDSIGLGYISLGQPSTTLSAGEAQRVKLSSELAKKTSKKTLYIFDEPTSDLHYNDINNLLKVISKLVDRGNTVIAIEHNLDVIKRSDWIIDLGQKGGREGGEILFEGKVDKLI